MTAALVLFIFAVLLAITRHRAWSAVCIVLSILTLAAQL